MPNNEPAKTAKIAWSAGGIELDQVGQRFGLTTLQGEVELRGHDALIAAVGLCRQANDCKIILIRPSQYGQTMVLPVRYQQIVQLGEVSTNYQLLPGDRIYVPSLTLWEDIKQTLQGSGDH